ncbi:phosphoribosyltransferase [Nitrosophilus labii]|uniref:phosphoribosyltransferase n=1 Tax=Nitrosophilus labii TaxID=2706014 RepID=UPI001657294A|nr:phosphoribosyltransferase family protein [Nitrosophilus labii]
MKKVYYPYEEFREDLKKLAKSIDFDFDTIIAIARGGMSIAHMLGEYFGIRDVYTINSIGYEDTKKLEGVMIFNLPDLRRRKKILIVDDIIDSGETMREVVKIIKDRYPRTDIKTAAIFYKKGADFKPDFFVKYAQDWIDFFWTTDLKV